MTAPLPVDRASFEQDLAAALYFEGWPDDKAVAAARAPYLTEHLWPAIAAALAAARAQGAAAALVEAADELEQRHAGYAVQSAWLRARVAATETTTVPTHAFRSISGEVCNVYGCGEPPEHPAHLYWPAAPSGVAPAEHDFTSDSQEFDPDICVVCEVRFSEHSGVAPDATPAAVERNPYLPAAPADGDHYMNDGSGRCKFCGAYGGTEEYQRPCLGEFKESAKMRSWAARKWRGDKPHVFKPYGRDGRGNHLCDECPKFGDDPVHIADEKAEAVVAEYHRAQESAGTQGADDDR